VFVRGLGFGRGRVDRGARVMDLGVMFR